MDPQDQQLNADRHSLSPYPQDGLNEVHYWTTTILPRGVTTSIAPHPFMEPWLPGVLPRIFTQCRFVCFLSLEPIQLFDFFLAIPTRTGIRKQFYLYDFAGSFTSTLFISSFSLFLNFSFSVFLYLNSCCLNVFFIQFSSYKCKIKSLLWISSFVLIPSKKKE